VAADEVADNNSHAQIERPQPSFLTEIQGNEYQQEEIKRNPQFSLPDEEKKGIEEGAGPILVDAEKEPVVTL
jgi:hypothetical protein